MFRDHLLQSIKNHCVHLTSVIMHTQIRPSSNDGHVGITITSPTLINTFSTSIACQVSDLASNGFDAMHLRITISRRLLSTPLITAASTDNDINSTSTV